MAAGIVKELDSSKGDWEVRYTNDMETIVTYPEGGTNEPETADL